MLSKKTLLAAAALVAFGAVASAQAATSPATATFQVLMKINKSCNISAGSASNIQIGAAGGVDSGSAVGQTGTNSFTVTCSNGTAYTIGLQSTNNASTAGLGTLKGSIGGNADTLTYQLKNGATSWGNASGSYVTATGSGIAQTYNPSATVTATSPSLVTPDSYSDTVTINVNF